MKFSLVDSVTTTTKQWNDKQKWFSAKSTHEPNFENTIYWWCIIVSVLINGMNVYRCYKEKDGNRWLIYRYIVAIERCCCRNSFFFCKGNRKCTNDVRIDSHIWSFHNNGHITNYVEFQSTCCRKHLFHAFASCCIVLRVYDNCSECRVLGHVL